MESILATASSIVSVGKRALDDLVSTLGDMCAEQTNSCIILVCTGRSTKCILDSIFEKVNKIGSCPVLTFTLKDSSFDEVSRLDRYCSDLEENPIILGVGAGVCIDVVKLVALRRKTKLVVYPTALSNDGLTSPVSVISSKNKKLRLPSAIPDGIFIDTNVTVKAPEKLTASGIFDLMSNANALLDVELFEDGNKGIHFACLLSKVATSHFIALGKLPISSKILHKYLSQGLILSGLSMGYAGSSVTASGSEHLICHALDSLNYGERATHGEKVLLGIMCAQALRKELKLQKLNKKVAKTLKFYATFKNPLELDISLEQLTEAVLLAPSLREERKTVLNLSSESLTEEQLKNCLSVLYQ